MELRPIKTEKEYDFYLDWVDQQFDKGIEPSTREGEILQVALLLIKAYEDIQYPIPKPDPIEMVKLKMKEKGLKNKDMVGKIGSKGYVSAILNKRKPMTLEIAKFFHKEFGIPADIFLS